MFKLVFAVHLLFAIFVVGPLVHATTTASRGIRTGDAAASASAARVVREYSYASVLVVLAGIGLMSLNSPDHKGEKVAEFGDTWIWLSVLLWLVAVVIGLTVVVPALTKAAKVIGEQGSVATLTARAGGAGGVVGLIFAGIVFLMVYQPGS
ncbi:MAG: hypothetical protein M3070_15715 [Actinomycetota bacterium]|nr:hypothetical protein [Actinomycetota bacterium]